jgi:hypothetical protein
VRLRGEGGPGLAQRPRRRVRRAAITAAAAVALAWAPARPAAADGSLAACEPAYEGAQLLRQRGKLRDARDQAAICARDACPEVARHDCAKWAEELGREIPTVVVVVRDEADRDVPVARVLVDGAPRPEVASGRAFELDPGGHVFRVERAGAPPVEQGFTVVQGEHDRPLRVTVVGAGGAVAPPLPLAPPPAPGAPPLAPPFAPRVPPRSESERPSIVPPVVVTGVSVALLATSAFLGLTGRQQLSDLRTSCAPACTDDQVGPVRTRLVASDVALGAGLVGAALATYLFAVRGTF